MQPKFLCVHLIFLLLPGPAAPAFAQVPKVKEMPKPFLNGIVDSWKKTGAAVGWIRVHETGAGYCEFVRGDGGEQGEPGDTPAFMLFEWDLPAVRKLPDPGMPFGLRLGRLPVTDLDLQGLAALKSLDTLDIGSDKVTDEGLKNLAGFKELQTLELYKAKVTGVGLKHLAGLKKLHTLVLWSSKVTDAGLTEVASLKSLQILHLHDTWVTDAGLKELTRLPILKKLHLGETKVTDSGLKHLAGLKSLEFLDVSDTKVTNAGITELKKAFPRCRIRR